MPSSKSRSCKRPANATINPAVEAGIKLIDQFYALGTTPQGTKRIKQIRAQAGGG